MKVITSNTLNPDDRRNLMKREGADLSAILPTAKDILRQVESVGDAALFEMTKKYDGVTLSSLEVQASEIQRAMEVLPQSTKDAILSASDSIRAFHKLQLPERLEVTTKPGVVCRLKWQPIQPVGLYVPGGTAPLLSTVLMLGIPASLAGCRDVLLCTPPLADGSVAPEILFAAGSVGVTRILKVGGGQAIAAMALGTETVPKVAKIFGPGNRFVAAMKSLISQPPYGTAIDMIAGPSELLVIADESANPRWVAADLLSQAEHGPDSAVVLVTSSTVLVTKVQEEIDRQLKLLPRSQVAGKALDNGFILLVGSTHEAIAFSNEYAPEHLILAMEAAESVAGKIQNAGSVFVGPMSSVVFGDYASGTNHTLPTGGFARSFGGLTVRDFLKAVFFQTVTSEGVRSLSNTVKTLARAERLEAHARAIEVREETK